MGVPTSKVGYTSAMLRREDHEVHKDMWGHWGKKNLRWGTKGILEGRKSFKRTVPYAICPWYRGRNVKVFRS